MMMEALVMENRNEWAIACDVQQRFMRHAALPSERLDYSARCSQMNNLGGDCYDFVPLADRGLALAVGDASGKGLAAALMIANVQSSLRTAAQLTGHHGPAVLDVVNRQVYSTSLANRYATLFHGVVDGAGRTMRYVNAGHNPPLLLRAGGAFEWLETGGAPVGMFPDWRYEEGVVQVQPGDVLIAYTDGVIEAENELGEQWGVEGLRATALQSRDECASQIVQDIFDAMNAFSKSRQLDDATVAVLRVQ